MRLEKWIIHNCGSWAYASGFVHDNPKFKDGDFIETSWIRAYSLTEKKLTTRNSVYELGAPASEFTPPRDEDVICMSG